MDAAPPTMPRRKQLALIAHDNRKADMLEWARYNRGTLSKHELFYGYLANLGELVCRGLSRGLGRCFAAIQEVLNDCRGTN